MPDVEFLTPREPEGGGEILDTGPRRRFPRWLFPVAALALAALIAAVVLTRGSSDSTPSSASTSPGPSSTAPADALDGLLVDLVADPVNHRIVALIGGRLYAVDAEGRVRAMSPAISASGTDDDVQLSFDPAADLVWTVRQGLPIASRLNPGVVQGFSARTLRQVARAVLPAPAQGSTALDGSLYVVASGRLYRTRPGRSGFGVVGRLGLDSTTPVADPVRHRLLVGERGSPLRIVSYDPKTRSVSRPVALPFGQGEVVVADGTIWAGGTTSSGAVLSRLDPASLRAGRNRAASLPLDGGGLTLAGAGERSLFVRPVVGSPARVLCLDARTGSLRGQLGSVPGLFTTLGGRGYVDPGSGIVPIDIGTCPG